MGNQASETTQAPEQEEEKPEMEPHCGRCIHLETCVIHHNAKVLLREFIGGPEPFKAYEMAEICALFKESE